MASKTKTQGTLLKIGDGAATEAFTTIGSIINIDGPGGDANIQDITDLESTAKEKGVGLVDNGEISAEMFWDYNDTQHAQLVTDQASGVSRNFQLYVPFGTPVTYDFAARIVSIRESYQPDDYMRANLTITIDGAITRT